jgi:hypothetical protein
VTELKTENKKLDEKYSKNFIPQEMFDWFLEETCVAFTQQMSDILSTKKSMVAEQMKSTKKQKQTLEV